MTQKYQHTEPCVMLVKIMITSKYNVIIRYGNKVNPLRGVLGCSLKDLVDKLQSLRLLGYNLLRVVEYQDI